MEIQAFLGSFALLSSLSKERAAILEGLKKGETVKDVAARFELAPSTVYYHRNKLKEEV